MDIGSTQSELYFCIYEKAKEQYVKKGIAIEDSEIKNRFEIRMKNERAYKAVVDLLTYYDAERQHFLSSIIISVSLTQKKISRRTAGKSILSGRIL